MLCPVWMVVWQFLTKQSIALPYNPATVLLGILPADLKTCVNINICTQMFFHLSVSGSNQDVFKDEWINKVWYSPYNKISFNNKKK